jgi:23S rRNA (uracil1939-C5)-methyltransferase
VQDNRDNLRRGAMVETRIEGLALGGRGIARVGGGMVLFVAHALPGDVVRARVTRRKPQYAEAEAIEILEPSPARRTPPCPLFGQCGGCKWQDLPYAEQLVWKERHVAEALRHIGRQQHLRIRPIIPSPSEWHYRNKMEYSFGAEADGSLSIGLHRSGDWRRVLDVPECLIAPPVFSEITGWARDELNRQRAGDPSLVPYDPVSHRGLLRHLVLRHSTHSGAVLCALLTNAPPWDAAEAFGRGLLERFPQCRGFLYGTTTALNDVARPEKVVFQLGEGAVEERVGQRTYRLSTFSFFQTNTAGAAVLYDVVRMFADLSGAERLLDAYCGTGTIGLHLSDQCASVTGIESVPEAVRDAQENAHANGARNCTFYCGDMGAVLGRLVAEHGAQTPFFDRVVVDPPRGGMDKKALRLLIGLRAPLVVYVSCNPATLARDASAFTEAGYEVAEVQPVDMFPQTFHVESVVRFRRTQNASAPG